MKFKRLIPALAMLLVSAILLGTSTFAWFSMNTQVTATGLQVTAVSNSKYLLIDGVDNATMKTTSADEKAATFVSGGTNADSNDKNVYPAYYAAESGNMPGTAAEGASLAVEGGKWYTANNRNSNNANNATKNVSEITSANLVKYVCTYRSWLTLSADSEDYTGKITVTSTLASGDAGTSVVVKLTQGANTETLKLVNGTAATTTVDFTITKTTSVAVEYYVYIDGTTTNVNSDYVNTPNTLTGALSVAFAIAA